MVSYRIKVSYRGTNYLGWQIQKKQGKTIQGELYNAFYTICHSQDIKIVAAGRTDAGVHALGQIFRTDIPFFISSNSLMRALNSHLTQDIRILAVEKCSEDFHPIRDAKWKEYLYFFSYGPKSPFSSDLLVHLPYSMDEEKMSVGASLFVGKHDFCNYYCKGTKMESTVRTIFSCELQHHQDIIGSVFPMDYYVLKVKGDGFLKQMIRLVMGTLWELGRNKISCGQIENSLKEPLKQKLAPVAPAKGLYLSQVAYHV